MSDTEELLARYRAGDQQAAAEIFHQYVSRLMALARSRLSRGMQRRVAPEDVVQSVYRSFFVGARDGRFDPTATGGDLWALLATITLNKVRKKVEFHKAKKRSVSQEQSVRGTGTHSFVPPEQVPDEPTPDEAQAATEELERVMERLTPQHRSILEQYLRGEHFSRIAESAGVAERTVRRVLEKVNKELQDRAAELAG